MVAGFTAAGLDAFVLGPIPTPAVAMLTRSLRCDLGVMISASHNPFADNGIKLFGPDGYKLSDELELEIEDMLEKDIYGQLAAPNDIGRPSVSTACTTATSNLPSAPCPATSPCTAYALRSTAQMALRTKWHRRPSGNSAPRS